MNPARWTHTYSDLMSLEVGDQTAYVECFESDNGLFRWEIVSTSGELLDYGYSLTIESAKLNAESRIFQP